MLKKCDSMARASTSRVGAEVTHAMTIQDHEITCLEHLVRALVSTRDVRRSGFQVRTVNYHDITWPIVWHVCYSENLHFLVCTWRARWLLPFSCPCGLFFFELSSSFFQHDETRDQGSGRRNGPQQVWNTVSLLLHEHDFYLSIKAIMNKARKNVIYHDVKLHVVEPGAIFVVQETVLLCHQAWNMLH